MAHYSFLDENNIVQKVIVGVDEDQLDTLPDEFDSWEEFYADQQGMTCKRTSYNTKLGEHLNDKDPFRGNYASIGCEYDPETDIFYPQKPWDSWLKDPDNYCWKAPIDKPNETDNFGWVEDLGEWELIPDPE
nr:hypothetical protein [uncultured Mediterranean phage uvMED]